MIVRALPTKLALPRLLADLVLVSCVALAPPAAGVDTLSAKELGQLCATEDGDPVAAATPCRIYILGFLEGAIATDPRVAMGVTMQIEKDNSFLARAHRTRLGRDMERYGPSFLAGFCVPQAVSLGTIASRVVDSLPATPADEPAREHVYRVLRSNYPCGPAEHES